MLPVMEAVPNFSNGRDPGFLDEVVRVASRRGVEVLDASRDPDHNRSVLTFLGAPPDVEAAALAVAELAMDRIDLRGHAGTHPRIGALDVLPFVPLVGCTLADAAAAARRVGGALSEMGLPVYFYGAASDPPGRGLAELRRGGVEALGPVFPAERLPDLDGGREGPHPTAGATCVGARKLLLAWNLWVEGVSLTDLHRIAAGIRERGGGFPGLRALAMELPEQGALQLSMNLEDVEAASPVEVFLAAERGVGAAGGEIVRTEVIGMVPETLVLQAAGLRLRLSETDPKRLLPSRLASHLARRGGGDLEALLNWVETQGDAVPADVREAVTRLSDRSRVSSPPGQAV